ncbi:MAG: ATP-dependent helicase HrpB, partial [Myxococcales bacterium]|nr:ATP-dependent helicase HrpB [Myxococcales bacterium]
VFDEFHERNLDGDLGLGWVEALRRNGRPDLRVCVMSATLDPGPLEVFLGAPSLHVEGRAFPVEVEHLDAPDTRPLEQQVAAAVRKAVLRDASGDVLVFVPGASEIRRAIETLGDFARANQLDLVPLHGDLPVAEQDRAVRPGARRKVIVSTNIAETSLTIPTVTAVVDSGLARVARHSPWTGLPRLDTVQISQASAVQRAGRAGRVGPGLCLRLYTKHAFASAPPRDVPEIRRADLAGTALLLHAHGPRDFAYFEPPPAPAFEAAEALLGRLGAVDGSGAVTEIGRRMLSLPLHPRLARVVLEAEARGSGARGALLAAVLAERELRLAARTRFGDARGASHESGSSDALARLEAFECVEAEGGGRGALRAHDVDGQAFDAARRVRDQLVRDMRVSAEPTRMLADEEDALRQALLTGFGDRVARRRTPNGRDVVFGDGGSASLAESSVVREAEFLLAIDADDGARGGTVVRVASAIEPEWLLDAAEETAVLAFDAKTERVVRRVELRYGRLVLDASERPAEPSPEATAVLLEAVAARGWGALFDVDEAEAFIRRWRFAASADSSIPAPGDDVIGTAVRAQVGDATSFDALRAHSLAVLLRGVVGAKVAEVERLAPAFVSLPGRSKVPVNYESGKPPWIESRLQDFLGLGEGPRVGGGREPLVFHLLAPNHRAVQVTTDLAGFWSRHYPDLRKQLMRRYPRHDWPDDPRNATPTRKR